MKNFQNYKQFKKYIRKNFRKYSKRYYVWAEYEIFSIEEAKHILHSHNKSTSKHKGVNLPIIMDEFIRDINRQCKTYYGIGTLIGVSITNEDYYWIFNIEGKKRFESCCIGYELF